MLRRGSAEHFQGCDFQNQEKTTASPAQRVAVGEEEQQNDTRPQAGVSERNRREAAALSAKVRVLTFEKSRSKRYDACSDVAAGEGFEPSQTESESVVLPLHNPAVPAVRLGTGLIIPKNEPMSTLFFKKFFLAATTITISQNNV